VTHPMTARARALRLNMTDAERLLWRRLRAEQLGVKFRRQTPIGPYIVDFVCIPGSLVVEVDGGQHNGAESDLRRDAFLQRQGYTVLRFWNNDVLSNIEGVLVTIHSQLAANHVCTIPPPPDLPHRAGEEKTARCEPRDAPPDLPHRAGEEKTARCELKDAPPDFSHKVGEELETPSPRVGRAGVGRCSP